MHKRALAQQSGHNHWFLEDMINTMQTAVKLQLLNKQLTYVLHSVAWAHGTHMRQFKGQDTPALCRTYNWNTESAGHV